MVRDCRRLHQDLRSLIERGDAGIVACELAEVAVTAAVVTNALELIPRKRVISDTLARELERRLADLDAAVAAVLQLPAA
jgi:hypothetical protein